MFSLQRIALALERLVVIRELEYAQSARAESLAVEQADKLSDMMDRQVTFIEDTRRYNAENAARQQEHNDKCIRWHRAVAEACNVTLSVDGRMQ